MSETVIGLWAEMVEGKGSKVDGYIKIEIRKIVWDVAWIIDAEVWLKFPIMQNEWNDVSASKNVGSQFWIVTIYVFKHKTRLQQKKDDIYMIMYKKKIIHEKFIFNVHKLHFMQDF